MTTVIPKGGKNRLDIANYRPIALLNIDDKIFAIIIVNQM